jgi:hypothetical protein
MSWLRLDDGFAHHPKVVDLNDREFRVWVKTLLWAARFRTNGRLTRGMFADVGLTARMAAKLVEHGLLETVGEDAWQIHDFAAYNPKDATAADRVKRYRDRNTNRNEPRNEQRNGGVTVTAPSRPLAPARDPSSSFYSEKDLDLRGEATHAQQRRRHYVETVAWQYEPPSLLEDLLAKGATPDEAEELLTLATAIAQRKQGENARAS